MAFTPVFSLVLLSACTGKEEPVDNRAPGAPTVSIGPNAARTDDDLVAVIDVESTDKDGDSVTYGYAWSQDGVPRTDLDTATVPASETAKGEDWKVTVTPNDGNLDGDPATAEITILNTAPIVTVLFSPAAPTTDDDVVAVPTATDADGDAVTLTYAWTVEGVAADYTFDTVPADATERGERWSVTVTPADPEEAGLPVTAEVAIENAAPEVLTATLSPESPYVTDDIVATVEGYDPDADEIAYSYRWFVDASEVQSGASDTLVAGGFAKHQIISVEVTPNDGSVDGAAFASADVTAINSLPTATSAAIDASAAYEATTLTCIPSGFADADGDSEAWTYAWSVGGVDVATGATLDGASFGRGDAVRCTATPFDGEASGTGVTSAALMISDTPPELTTVDLSTYVPTENDTISVTLGLGSDADGDSVTYGYDWYVNGGSVSSSPTLSANRFAKGDRIYVVVTPSDGTVLGVPVTSAVATGTNTPPVMGSLSLSPSSVFTNSTITASVSATDLDGDSITHVYDWYVDGLPRGSSTSATLSGGSYFDKGQSVYVIVTPNDGDIDGTSSTSGVVVVSNTAPGAAAVSITPSSPAMGDDLTCSVSTASTDADGDAIAYQFTWEVDGSSYTSAADSTTSSTVDGGDVNASETWTCSVAASDGVDSSATAQASVTAEATDYTTAFGNQMLVVQSGSFSMGSGRGDPSGTYLDHNVTFTHALWLGESEVTQAQWAAWTGAPDTTPSWFASCDGCPVEEVSWEDAATYVNALSAAEGLTPCYLADGSDIAAAYVADPYSCEGYRLPTEAEWEYAARAGDNTTYSGSNTVEDVAWCAGTASGQTQAVCTLDPNSWGLCDMSGNVWEWTNDWYSSSYGGYGSGSPSTDPPGPSGGSNRSVRGGGWDSADTRVAQLAWRDSTYPTYTSYVVGLRIARTIP